MVSAHDFVPLKPITVYILLALASKEKHGYAIMKFVEEETNGQIQIRIGSLYSLLHKLLENGLIEESNKEDFEHGETRRRKYRLTRLGREVFTVETKRLKEILVSLTAKFGKYLEGSSIG